MRLEVKEGRLIVSPPTVAEIAEEAKREKEFQREMAKLADGTRSGAIGSKDSGQE